MAAAVAGRSRAARRAHPFINLIAAEGLTAKRRAAARIELPCSTAPMIRKRRFRDIGAGMTTSQVSQPTLSSHECRFHAIGNCSRVSADPKRWLRRCLLSLGYQPADAPPRSAPHRLRDTAKAKWCWHTAADLDSGPTHHYAFRSIPCLRFFNSSHNSFSSSLIFPYVRHRCPFTSNFSSSARRTKSTVGRLQPHA